MTPQARALHEVIIRALQSVLSAWQRYLKESDTQNPVAEIRQQQRRIEAPDDAVTGHASLPRRDATPQTDNASPDSSPEIR